MSKFVEDLILLRLLYVGFLFVVAVSVLSLRSELSGEPGESKSWSLVCLTISVAVFVVFTAFYPWFMTEAGYSLSEDEHREVLSRRVVPAAVALALVVLGRLVVWMKGLRRRSLVIMDLVVSSLVWYRLGGQWLLGFV